MMMIRIIYLPSFFSIVTEVRARSGKATLMSCKITVTDGQNYNFLSPQAKSK